MKVILTDVDANEDNNWRKYYEIKTPKNSIDFGHMEPEDANLYRDLSCVFSIPDMLMEAFEAGKNGEILEFENVDEKCD